MYFCNNVDDNLAVDKIRMFRPNKLSIVPWEATRTRAWVRRSLDTNTGGFLLSPFPQNVRGFMERIWEQWKESFAAIESEELGSVNHVILCTLCNCPRIAAARTPASWGQLVGDIFLIYIFVSKFSVCPSQVLVSVRSVSWLSTVPAEAVLSTRNMFDNIQTNTKSTTLRKAERAHHFDSRQKDFF